MPFAPGFDRTEALDLLNFCAIIEDGVAPPIPKDPPDGWTLVFPSPVIGPFDNRWQLWQRKADGAFAVVVRGTTPKASSILEDLVAVMIKGKGSLQVGGSQLDYKFADDPQADVHLGFALGALLLLEDPTDGILSRFKKNGIGAGAKVYVTGHSQGAAIATLIRSYLHYAADAPGQVAYKTYVYAQPKPGNDHYAEDFESRFCNSDLAFRVTNSLDWVPQVPFTIELLSDINQPNILSILGHVAIPVEAKPLSALGSILAPLQSKLSAFGNILEPLALLQKAGGAILGLAEALGQSKMQSAAASLAKLGIAAKPASPLEAGKLVAPFALTLNYVNAATEIALMGVPCVGDQCKDGFFEHHASTYYGLLQAQFP